MRIKNNSILYGLTAIIMVAAIVFYFSDRSHKLYGNDKDSIEKVIKSIEGYGNESVEILEIKDFYDQRVVAFLSNNSPAYIQFSKNQKSNYEWTEIQKNATDSFATNLIKVSKDKTQNIKFMIVTNEKNDIAKMELTVNEQVIEQQFSVRRKSVTWIDLPDTNDKTYTFKYKYYDKDGKVIG